MRKEIRGTQQRDQQFRQRPAKNGNRVAKPAEKEMPSFVNDQIQVVEKQKAAAIGSCIDQKKQIEAQPRDSRISLNRLPLTEIVVEQSHGNQRTSCGENG